MKLGTYFGTRKDAVKWVRKHYSIPFQLVSSKTGKVYVYEGKRR